MKYLLVIFFNIYSIAALAQKNTYMEFDARGINKLHILTEEVFKINLKTSKTDKIYLRTQSEGEYYNDISIEVKLEEGQMLLSSKFPARLQNGYDKLSAHKVFSLEITLEIPEDLEIYVRSNQASLHGLGKYKYMEVELRTGYCKLNDFKGNALINTYSGNVEIETSNAMVTAHSRSGKVLNQGFSSGDHSIEIGSITGDISVRKN